MKRERLAFGVVHEVAMVEGVGDGPVERGPWWGFVVGWGEKARGHGLSMYCVVVAIVVVAVAFRSSRI